MANPDLKQARSHANAPGLQVSPGTNGIGGVDSVRAAGPCVCCSVRAASVQVGKSGRASCQAAHFSWLSVNLWPCFGARKHGHRARPGLGSVAAVNGSVEGCFCRYIIMRSVMVAKISHDSAQASGERAKCPERKRRPTPSEPPPRRPARPSAARAAVGACEAPCPKRSVPPRAVGGTNGGGGESEIALHQAVRVPSWIFRDGVGPAAPGRHGPGFGRRYRRRESHWRTPNRRRAAVASAAVASVDVRAAPGDEERRPTPPPPCGPCPGRSSSVHRGRRSLRRRCWRPRRRGRTARLGPRPPRPIGGHGRRQRISPPPRV